MENALPPRYLVIASIIFFLLAVAALGFAFGLEPFAETHTPYNFLINIAAGCGGISITLAVAALLIHLRQDGLRANGSSRINKVDTNEQDAFQADNAGIAIGKSVGVIAETKLFQFTERPTIITGASDERTQGIYVMPGYDGPAGELIRQLLHSLGHECDAPQHCKAPELSRNRQNLMRNNLVLICGPVMNDFSAEVNSRLGRVEWFNGFYFERLHFASDVDAQQREEEWTIQHKGIKDAVRKWKPGYPCPGLHIPFLGLPRDGVSDDYGLIYIGPNPLNPANWLVWVGGIGPAASYGAAIAFRNQNDLHLLAHGLADTRRYASGLVHYQYHAEDPLDGAIANMLVTGGSLDD